MHPSLSLPPPTRLTINQPCVDDLKTIPLQDHPIRKSCRAYTRRNLVQGGGVVKGNQDGASPVEVASDMMGFNWKD